MDIIVGGGKYGCIAVEYLRKNKRGFVLVDKDPNCLATRRFKLKPATQISEEGEYFLEGDMPQVLELITRLKPEYVFPTAPIHVAAELVKSKFEFTPWDEVIDCILANLPSSVILQAGEGNLIVSYNRDKECLERCDAPKVCPVSRKRKPCTMDKLVRFAYPEGITLTSYQLAPGMGALKGKELLELLAQAQKRDRLVVATACGCHGYFTALKKM
jgi:hypothetical protein